MGRRKSIINLNRVVGKVILMWVERAIKEWCLRQGHLCTGLELGEIES